MNRPVRAAAAGGDAASPEAGLARAPGPQRGSFGGRGFVEPTLRDLLDDPLVRALMRSDRVKPGDVEALFAAAGDGGDGER